MKAVIPVAGLGTRMLPATKAIPKEMLIIADKPLIQYIVQECVAAGIKEIVLVSHASKTAVENHFDTAFELEHMLAEKGKTALLEEVRGICPPDVRVIQVRQGQAKGLGHAVLCAREVVGNEAFAVLLPDVLIDDAESDLSRDNLAAMMARYQAAGRSQIMVEAVPMEQVDKYGVADCGGVAVAAGSSAPMRAVVEKPPVEQAPSNLAVVGRYVLSPAIWDCLAHTAPGAGGEIQLTDAIAALMQTETVEAFAMTGRSHDCGDKLGYMKAFVTYAKRHQVYGAVFAQWLDSAQ